MNLVNIKVRRYPQFIKGIVIENGRRWLAIAENIVDYVLDGYLFLNVAYIDEIYEISHESLEYQVLLLKKPQQSFACLDDYISLMNYLKSEKLLIAVGLHKQQSFVVGFIKGIYNNSFVLYAIDVTLKKNYAVRVEYRTIRYISIMSDYLLSISNYLDGHWNISGTLKND